MKSNLLIILLILLTASSASGQEKDTFVQFSSPSVDWIEIQVKCREHRADSAYLLALLKNIIGKKNEEGKHFDDHIAQVGNCYMDCLKNPLESSNILVIGQLIYYCQEKSPEAINFYFKNVALIDKTMAGVNSSYAEAVLAHVIFTREIEPFIGKGQPFDWQKKRIDLVPEYPMLSNLFIKYLDENLEVYIANELKTYINETDISSTKSWTLILDRFKIEYPEYSRLDVLFLKQKTKYYEFNKLWPECADVAYTYLQKYGSQLDYIDLNDAIWKWIFLHSDDKEKLEASIAWMEQLVLPIAPDWGPGLDTYANLLYKTGRRQKAMIWSNKSIEVQKAFIEKDKIEKEKHGRKPSSTQLNWLNNYQTNLKRMQKHLPTWPSGEVD